MLFPNLSRLLCLASAGSMFLLWIAAFDLIRLPGQVPAKNLTTPFVSANIQPAYLEPGTDTLPGISSNHSSDSPIPEEEKAGRIDMESQDGAFLTDRFIDTLKTYCSRFHIPSPAVTPRITVATLRTVLGDTGPGPFKKRHLCRIEDRGPPKQIT